MNTPNQNYVKQYEIGLFGRIMVSIGEHYQDVMDNIAEKVDKWETASVLTLNKIRELEDEYRDTFSDAGWLNMVEPKIDLANLHTGKRRYKLLTEVWNTLMKTLNKNS